MANSSFSYLPLIASMVALLPAGVLADGRISLTQGNTTLARASEVIRGERGATFAPGNRVATTDNGGMQLWLEDDSIIVLGTSTDLRFDAYRADTRTIELSSSAGAMRMVPGAFEPTLQTGIASITALGTDFTSVLCVGQCGASPAGLYVKVDAGRVRVRNAAGSIEAGAGEYVFTPSASTAPRLIQEPTGTLPILMASLEFDLDDLGLDIELVVLPTIPDLPVDPSPSTPP